MPQPLMPQGVEHWQRLIYRRGWQPVPQPLMPQGVEHLGYEALVAAKEACPNH